MNYNASTVKTLEPLEHMRQYPGMYIGSKDENGLHHLIKEIVSNSIDEYLNGAGNEILVQLNTDNSIYIKDNGRGIPHGIHSSGCSVLQACFGIANTGGKFDNATGETGYNTSGGEHGTGAKAVNALSTKLIVTSSNNGLIETVEFSKGHFIKYSKDACEKTQTGVTVLFYPDEEILETIKFNPQRIKNMLQEFSFLCTGLKFIFKDLNTNEESIYYSDNGLYDFMNHLAKDSLITSPFYFFKSSGKIQLEAIVGYTSKYNNIVKLYTNNIPQEKGTHLTGFKTAWTLGLNQFAKNQKLLKNDNDKITGTDLEEGQILILNFKMIDPVFKGQNKEELSSSEGRTYTQKFTSEAIKENEFIYGQSFKLIFEKAVSARRARDAARKARDAARKPKVKGLKAKMALSDKFIDCNSKDPEKRNLLLVEGLSAAGSTLESRNVETDCIYMLRGKILSVLKTDLNRVLNNVELSDIIQVIGAGIGEKFDLSKMQFDKIVITADQDADGMAIELLLITFFYTYMRPLVEAGKLYRAVTPLYIVETKNQKYYLYTEKELEDWKQIHSEKYELSHCKGLGELSAQTLKEVCFEHQRYKRITVSDADATTKLLEVLEGVAVQPRKQFIYNNAEKLGFNFL